MKTLLTSLACLSLLGGCLADAAGGKGLEDDVPVGGKADSFRNPTEHGDLAFGPPSATELDPEDARFHAWTFTLTGDADVRLWTSSRLNLDTVMYLYRRDSDDERWGSYIRKNDDHEGSPLSRIERSLGEGQYRVIVKGYKTIYSGGFSLTGQCEGDGCPGGGTDVDEPLPDETGFTAGCLDKLFADLRSEVWFHDELNVEWDQRSVLDGTKRLAVGYFGQLVLEHDPELPDDVYVEYHGTRRGGSVIEVTTGADWSYEFTFDGEGNLLMYYFNDQSPWAHYFCGERGEATIEEPTEFCSGKLADYLPVEADTGLDFDETYHPDQPNDEIPSWAWSALAAYREAVSIGEDVEVSIEGETHQTRDGFGTSAEATFSASGHDAIRYLAGDSEWGSTWVLTAEAADGSRSMVCRED